MRDSILQEIRKKHSELYYACAWCKGVFERSTDRKVDTLDDINDAISHTICPVCKRKQLAEAKEVKGMRLGNFIRKAADFCDRNQPKVENAVISASQKVTSEANRLAIRSLTLTHRVLSSVNAKIESRIDTDDAGNPAVDPSLDPHYLDDERKEFEKDMLDSAKNIEDNGVMSK